MFVPSAGNKPKSLHNAVSLEAPAWLCRCPTQHPQHHLFTKSCREWCSLLTSSCKLRRKTYLIFQKLCSCLRGSQILQSSILSRPPNAVPVPAWAHTRMSICARASFSWREDRPRRRRCPKFWVHSISFQGRKQSAWTGHMLRPTYYVTVFSKGGKKRRPFEESHVLRAVRHLNVFLSKYLPGHMYRETCEWIMKVIIIHTPDNSNKTRWKTWPSSPLASAFGVHLCFCESGGAQTGNKNALTVVDIFLLRFTLYFAWI